MWVSTNNEIILQRQVVLAVAAYTVLLPELDPL